MLSFFFFSSRRRHTRFDCDWSSDVCSSDLHHFAVNVLSQGQRELAGKLGRSSANTPQKLKGIKTKPAPVSGAPILTEALGWIECRVVATLPSGDHTLVLGEVVEAGVEHDGGQPLTLPDAGFKYAG